MDYENEFGIIILAIVTYIFSKYGLNSDCTANEVRNRYSFSLIFYALILLIF